MATYSPNEIAALINLVGGWGPGSKAKAPAFLDVAIAVCLAESGGDENAYNPPNLPGKPLPTRYAVGLWQVMYPTHKDLLKKYGEQYSTVPGSVKPATHPLVNTASARDIYLAAGGWGPWVAYTSGAYKKHLGHGQAAYEWISNKSNMEAFAAKMKNYGGNFDTTVKTSDGGMSIAGFLEQFPAFFVQYTKNLGVAIGVFLIGLILLLLGIVIFANRAGLSKKVPGPIGLVANAVKK